MPSRPFASLGASAQGDRGLLSLFQANDVPVLGGVIPGIDYQVDDAEVRMQLLQVLQVHLFEPLLIVEVGLFGQGVGFVILLGPSQYPGDGHLLRTVGLKDDEGPVVPGGYGGGTPSQ